MIDFFGMIMDDPNIGADFKKAMGADDFDSYEYEIEVTPEESNEQNNEQSKTANELLKVKK